jgi:predicted ATP-binding protein involved in virulence
MFLKKISLRNLRSLKDIELSFTSQDSNQVRKWTLLLGENGSGKSTLLKGIGLLLAGSEALSEIMGKPDQWIRVGAKAADLEAVVVTNEGNERSIHLRLDRKNDIADVVRNNHAGLSQLDQALKHTPRNYLTVGYGVSRRLSLSSSSTRATVSSFNSRRSASLASLFNSDATMNSLETWAMDLHYRRGKTGLGVVQKALDKLLPDISFRGIDRRNRKLMFNTPDGPISLAFLSDGYQNVAAWCGDLLFRITETFNDYKNPLSARGVLLLDEIDLHLHPVWQRQLRSYLTDKLPNFQIVATTHSALTAQQASKHELFVVKRNSRKIPTLIPYDGDPQKLMIHQLLLSEAFGLPTLDSPQIQEKKNAYKTLESKPKLTRSEKQKLNELKVDLADMPEWSRESTRDRQSISVMKEIHSVLVARRKDSK